MTRGALVSSQGGTSAHSQRNSRSRRDFAAQRPLTKGQFCQGSARDSTRRRSGSMPGLDPRGDSALMLSDACTSEFVMRLGLKDLWSVSPPCLRHPMSCPPGSQTYGLRPMSFMFLVTLSCQIALVPPLPLPSLSASSPSVSPSRWPGRVPLPGVPAV